MKKLDKKFVMNIYEEIVNTNMEYYSTAYDDTDIQDNYPTEIKNRISFVQSLDPDRKKILLSYMRQIIIDTISNVFGIIDGSSYLEDFNEGDFELKYGNHIKQIISGDLQDLFLEFVENKIQQVNQ